MIIGRLILPFVLCLCLILTIACPPQGSIAQSINHRRLQVVTSISPLSDMVANVGGNRVTVSYFVPLNVDPHTFEPTFSALKPVSQAQLIFLNGDGLDRAARQNLGAIKDKRCQIIDLSTSIPQQAKNSADPHYWLDLKLAINYVHCISDALCRIDPTNSDYFKHNAGDYIAKIQSIDRHYQTACFALPPGCRSLLLSHNAWTYVSSRYGFNVVGTIEQGGQEPSARHLSMLITRARAAHVQAILSEPGHNLKIVKMVQQDSNIPVTLHMVEESLAEPPYNTYLGMMEANLQTLCTLSCKH